MMDIIPINIHHREKITSSQEYRIILTKEGLEKFLYYKDENKWYLGQPVAFTRKDWELLIKIPIEQLFLPETAYVGDFKVRDLKCGEKCWVLVKKDTFRPCRIVKVGKNSDYLVRLNDVTCLETLTAGRGSLFEKKPRKAPKIVKHVVLELEAEVFSWRESENRVVVRFYGNKNPSSHNIFNLEGESLWEVLKE